jgi:hypothetical protein
VTALAVGAGDRLWNGAGLTATVTEAGRAGVYGVVDGGRDVVRLWVTDWRPAMSCDYCGDAAELQLTDGQDGDLLCRCCARNHFDQLSNWTRPIPRKVIRRLYRECERLA